MATLAVAVPRVVHAQDENGVYDPDEVTKAARLSSKYKAAQVLKDAYPEKLLRAGVEGSAQIECIVDANGKVEPGSAVVVVTSVPAFGAAAKEAVEKFDFKPAEVKGAPVKSRVLVPLVFKIR